MSVSAGLFVFFFFAVQFPPESCLQSFCLLLGIEASWTGRVLNAEEVRTVGFVVTLKNCSSVSFNLS